MTIDPGITILLVEDAKLMLKMEKKTLNQLGFNNIIEAIDGDDAIQKLQEQAKVNLIISDWNMPKKSGYDLLVWVRGNDKFKNLPFLMATGRGEKKEVAKASDAGVSSFISKPFNADELREKIEEAFSEKKVETEAVPQKRVFQTTASGKVILKMAHIQITDHLVLGVLKHLIKTGELKPQHFELETECMSGWNPVANALEKGTVAGACVLAPIAMDLYSYGVPLNLILLAHKNGSIFVRNLVGGEYKEPYQDFFRGKTFYLPHTMSIHHILAHTFFTGIGLKAGDTSDDSVDVSFEVVPPIKMPEFLSENPDACGYLVAEPLGTKAIANGIAELQFLSSELWDNHPCCVVVMQQDFIQQYTEAVYEFTEMLVYAGKYIEQKVDLAAEIGVSFLDPDRKLGLKVPLLRNVLTEPLGIKTNDLFPVISELDRIQQYMVHKIGIGKLIDLDQFVDLRFARKACDTGATATQTAVRQTATADVLNVLQKRAEQSEDQKIKSKVEKEGKYLIFSLGEQKLGIDILKIKEIVGMKPIRPIPQSPHYVKGLINLRGNIIPVIDLRLKFDLEAVEYNERTCIIVLEIENGGKVIPLGIAVDAVSEVANIMAKDIEETPYFGANVGTEYILGIAKSKERVNILLDIDRVLGQLVV